MPAPPGRKTQGEQEKVSQEENKAFALVLASLATAWYKSSVITLFELLRLSDRNAAGIVSACSTHGLEVILTGEA
jgi:hypothetical protein